MPELPFDSFLKCLPVEILYWLSHSHHNFNSLYMAFFSSSNIFIIASLKSLLNQTWEHSDSLI